MVGAEAGGVNHGFGTRWVMQVTCATLCATKTVTLFTNLWRVSPHIRRTSATPFEYFSGSKGLPEG